MGPGPGGDERCAQTAPRGQARCALPWRLEGRVGPPRGQAASEGVEGGSLAGLGLGCVCVARGVGGVPGGRAALGAGRGVRGVGTGGLGVRWGCGGWVGSLTLGGGRSRRSSLSRGPRDPLATPPPRGGGEVR